MSTLLPTSIVGSLPKPSWLAEPETLWSPWRLEDAELDEGRRDALHLAAAEQAVAGLDVISDGEQTRQHFVTTFIEHLSGVDFARRETVRIRDRYDASVPTVVGPVRRERPVFVDDAASLRTRTDKPLKWALPGPMTMIDTLYDAQVHKTDRILKKLYLKPGMELLDIGCGWGFLLIEAAKKYGVKGTGITLSHEQEDAFNERIKKEGLSDLLCVKRMDYRDLPQLSHKFDRIVSVGMVEHVGRENYDKFLTCADEVLKPGGLFLLHFISALKEHPGDPWIKKYIFPGGMVPSLREMESAAADHRFYTLDVESLRRHYNRTLRCWNANFQAHKDEVRKMFDEQFVRMWELYLCACAATFYNGIIDLHQILWSKGVNNDLPMIRWY